MIPEASATAEGDLGRTPFAHLLVYAMDRRLTGALFLTEPGGAAGEPAAPEAAAAGAPQPPAGVTHVVRLVRGAPVKVRPGDQHAMLGALLVERGLVSDELLRGSLLAKGRLGEVLVLAGALDATQLEAALEDQFVRRMTRLFALPPATAYRYFDAHCELVDWGAEAAIDPLALLWAGLEAHAGASSMMEGTLERLGELPIKLHPAASLGRFGFSGPDREAVDRLQASPRSLTQHVADGAVPEERLRRIVYALLITRQLDLGSTASPVGSDDPSRQAPAPPVGVGRMQLKKMQLPVAAAPDLPGDGERAQVSPRTTSRRRSLASMPAVEVPPAPAESPLPEPAPKPARGSGTRPVGYVGLAGYDDAPEPARPPAPADLTPPSLCRLAEERIRERDGAGALELAERARAAEPANSDYLAVWALARSMLPGADLKALTIDLDELLHDETPHPKARYVRGLLRKRLGDDAGALRDLRRVVEVDAGNADAARELAALEARQPKRGGLLARLFRR